MTKIPDNKLKGFINNMLTDRKERKFVETVDLQIGLKVIRNILSFYRTMTQIKISVLSVL